MIEVSLCSLAVNQNFIKICHFYHFRNFYVFESLVKLEIGVVCIHAIPECCEKKLYGNGSAPFIVRRSINSFGNILSEWEGNTALPNNSIIKCTIYWRCAKQFTFLSVTMETSPDKQQLNI